MSAITGIFYRNGRKIDPELIEKMNDKLLHRGPDGSAFWCKNNIALGHQMLYTTPESLHEKLPFHDEKAGLVITADARIDNRKELSEELDIEDKENVSDSYFILKSYEKWGEKCPEYLLGDFAFAIWDENEEKLFCARDHMGVKPFYYYLDDEIFVFGTEIKAIFAVEEIPRIINEKQIAFFLELIYKDRDITSYNEILRLPSAHFINLNNKDFKFKQYWKLEPYNKIRFESDEEYENVFREIFTKSVQCRLRGAFSVGSMLSGGLDSSSVACMAQKILEKENKSLKTFSAIFDSVPQSNERDFIEIVLNSAQFDYYFIKGDQISPLKDIDKLFFYGDQLLVFPNHFILWEIYNKASVNDVRVLLDGIEGDVTVSHGDALYAELFHKKKLRALFNEINITSKRTGKKRYQIALSSLSEFIPQFLRKKALNKNKKNFKIINENFADKIKLSAIFEEIEKNKMEKKTAGEKHCSLLEAPFLQLQMEFTDWMAGYHSIEARHPFFDKRLVEFCLAIPVEKKRFQGWNRYIMRKSMSKILPNEIQWRENKGNLSYNFNHSLMKYEKDFLDKIIQKDIYLINDYIDAKKIQEIYNEFESGKNNKNTMQLWNALILLLWQYKNDS